MLAKLKRMFRLKDSTKLKVFKIVNKFVFCRIVDFHLPRIGVDGVDCVICGKKFEGFKK